MALSKSKIDQNMLPQEKCSALVTAYAKEGYTYMHLQDLGVDEMNRPISWKYVHSLVHQILNVEGFSIQRCKYCTVIEPSAANPHGSTNRTQQEAEESGGMLPMVDNRVWLGLLTKNHLQWCQRNDIDPVRFLHPPATITDERVDNPYCDVYVPPLPEDDLDDGDGSMCPPGEQHAPSYDGQM